MKAKKPKAYEFKWKKVLSISPLKCQKPVKQIRIYYDLLDTCEHIW